VGDGRDSMLDFFYFWYRRGIKKEDISSKDFKRLPQKSEERKYKGVVLIVMILA
jgi:hypothetical protein